MKRDLLLITISIILIVVGSTGLVLAIVHGDSALDILDKLGGYLTGCAALLALILTGKFISQIKAKKTMDIIFDNFHVINAIVREVKQIQSECARNNVLTSIVNNEHHAVKVYSIEIRNFHEHVDLFETISVIADNKKITLLYEELIERLGGINFYYGQFVKYTGDENYQKRIECIENAEQLSKQASAKANQLLKEVRSIFV